MTYEFLIYDRPEDGIARITLNRPQSLNAMHLPLLYEIYEAAKEAEEDPTVVALIYRGAGRAFSVGRDFKYSGELQTGDPEGWAAWRKRYKDFGRQTWMFPKATIAQVHGYALGGGHNLAVSCDITVCATDTKFGYPEARYGLLTGGTHMWNWLMGPKKTKEFLFTGSTFDAAEALTFGLINRVVAPEHLQESVTEIARNIVAIERKNPGYIRANKYLINQRHVEFMTMSSMNPEGSEERAYQAEYTAQLIKSQAEFYTRVATEGMREALDDLHSGFTSRT